MALLEPPPSLAGRQAPFSSAAESWVKFPTFSQAGGCHLQGDSWVSHKQPFNQKEGWGVEVKNVPNLEWSKTAQFLRIVTVVAAVRMQLTGDNAPPHLFPLLLALILICPWIGFMELWQSFSTVWLDFLSPDSTMHPKYPSTPPVTHLKEGSASDLHMQMISISYHFSLTRLSLSRETCTRCYKKRKGHWHISAPKRIHLFQALNTAGNLTVAWLGRVLRGCITTSGGFSFRLKIKLVTTGPRKCLKSRVGRKRQGNGVCEIQSSFIGKSPSSPSA